MKTLRTLFLLFHMLPFVALAQYTGGQGRGDVMVALALAPSCANPSSGGTIGSAQSICPNATPAELTELTAPGGSYTGTLEYLWQSSTTDASSGFTDISGATSATYSPGALSTTTWFRRQVRVDCESTWLLSNAVEVTVVNALPTAVITNNTGSTELTCARTAISLEASGGVSYAWSGGLGSSSTASASSPATYTVTVTASNGCTDTESIIITQDITTPSALITNNTGSTQLTCARTAISLEAGGGVSYAWSGGLGSSAGASVTNPGTYTVTATASNGCTDTESIGITQDITVPTAVITNNTGSTELTCARTAISLEASGGVSYAWSGGLGSIATASATSPATYTVTVTASNGCTDTESIIITQDITTPTAVITNNTGSTQLTCARTAISLEASGGSSYVWSGGLGSSALASATSPATYTVTVTAANGCTDTETILITQNITPPVAVITNNTGSTQLTCSLTAISLEASGGSPYLWSAGLGSNTSVSITDPATYTVTVTGTNGCTDTESITITQDITVPTATITNNTGSTQLTCTCTSISLTAGGGTSYSWSGGLGSNAAASVTSPSTYTVTATAANGCTDTESIIITQDITVPTATITNNTGSTELTCLRTAISLTAGGGTSYSWSGGLGSNAAASVTSPSTYTVTATAANGCTDTESITISQDITAPTATVTNNTGISELTCSLTSISLEASGGISYAWSGGLGSSAMASATSPATYTVTVTATNGCTDTESITITQDITVPTATITNNTGSTQLTCTRTSISLTAGGGTSYSWSGGLGSNAAASVTSPSTYTVTVTATNGCTYTESITITQDITAPNAIITNNTGISELTCALTSISLEASGGISYAWSGGLGNSATASATSPATYTVTVTAANGCTDTETIFITQNITPPVAVITNNTGSTQLTCTRTSISLTAGGGTSYSWSGGLGSNASTSATSPATYTMTATAANGCTDTESILISQNIAAATPVITAGGATSFCDGGQVQLTSSSATSYIWSTGANTAAVQTSASGNYVVTVTYANGCTAVSAATTITVIPNTSNTTSVTDCFSYTWSVNSQVYTQSATYTSVSVCHTEILNLYLEKPHFTQQPSTASHKTTPGIAMPAYTVAVSGGSGHTYQWYSNTTYTNTGGTLIPGAQSTTYLPPTQNTGTTYYYVRTTTSNGCQAASEPSGFIQVCGQ